MFEMFSYCDFSDAYSQVPISDETLKNNPIVASVSGLSKNVKYLRLPQGCKTSTGIFISILNHIFMELAEFLFIFLDDTVIGSEKSESKHWLRLLQFFNTAEKAGLRIGLPKSIFFAIQFEFLNFEIAHGSLGWFRVLTI